MMVYYDSIYPEYGFASNKGYGSAEHIAALKKYWYDTDSQKNLY